MKLFSFNHANSLLARISSLIRLIAVLATLACVGCGDPNVPRKLVSVGGKVTLDGKPLPRGGVRFLAVDGQSIAVSPMGELDETGNCMLDGTTNQIMFGEMLRVCGSYLSPSWAWNDNQTDGQPNNGVYSGFGWWTLSSQTPSPYAFPSVYHGVSGAGDGGSNPFTFNDGCLQGDPNFQHNGIPFQSGSTSTNCNQCILNTSHQGGMVCGIGDGSVRFVSASINVNTWVDACTPADGIVLGSDW